MATGEPFSRVFRLPITVKRADQEVQPPAKHIRQPSPELPPILPCRYPEIMPRLSPATLSELRRRAFAQSPFDLIRAIEATGHIPQDVVPVNSAAAFASVSRTFILRRIRRKELRSYRVGQRHLVSLAELITVADAMLPSRSFVPSPSGGPAKGSHPPFISKAARVRELQSSMGTVDGADCLSSPPGFRLPDGPDDGPMLLDELD